MDITTLRQRQSLPLEAKVVMTKNRIISFYDKLDGMVSISFSGGLDSMVLLHIAREVFPSIPAVFVNTGLEYPEIVQFVKTHSDVTILKPGMNFRQVLKTYGFPVVSKKVARQIRTLKAPTPKNVATRNLYLTGYNRKGVFRPFWRLSHKWRFLLDAPFQISERCCEVMKKRPLGNYGKQTGCFPIIGTRTAESQNRTNIYLRNGCNSFGGQPKSRPLSCWHRSDVLEYVVTRNLAYCSVYGDIKQDSAQQYYTTGVNATGCIFCCFGVHLESFPNRFEQLKKSHPKLYNYCMNKLGLHEVLTFIQVRH